MDIAEIIVKKLQYELTESENRLFMEWLEASRENTAVFQRLQASKAKGGQIPNLDQLDPKAVLAKMAINYRAKRKKRAFASLFKYAAVFTGFLFTGYGIWQYATATDHVSTIDATSVTLETGNGSVKVLSSEKSEDIIDELGNFLGKSHQNVIDYTDAAQQDALVFNVLKVPNGKTFNIKLSDGTLVYLNAGSSLKYPVKFSKTGSRKVILNGEAFFEVSKDVKHPFIVQADNLDITVLGTKFNVNSYSEEATINTVLVEGSVKLSGHGNSPELLEPGHKGEWDRAQEKITFTKVETGIYTGWMEGKLVINKLSFDKIIIKLERYYGVTIENRNKNIKAQVYTAEFLYESLEQVLNSFQVDTDFKYEIKDKNITIY